MIERKFTTMYDSFGTPIFEGDTVEYFHQNYCHKGRFRNILENEPERDYILQAKKEGYTAEYRYRIYTGQELVQMYKPCRGVVKWNPEYVTYEPVVYSEDDYNNNCFRYVIGYGNSKFAYCMVVSLKPRSPSQFWEGP